MRHHIQVLISAFYLGREIIVIGYVIGAAFDRQLVSLYIEELAENAVFIPMVFVAGFLFSFGFIPGSQNRLEPKRMDFTVNRSKLVRQRNLFTNRFWEKVCA